MFDARGKIFTCFHTSVNICFNMFSCVLYIFAHFNMFVFVCNTFSFVCTCVYMFLHVLIFFTNECVYIFSFPVTHWITESLSLLTYKDRPKRFVTFETCWQFQNFWAISFFFNSGTFYFFLAKDPQVLFSPIFNSDILELFCLQ